MGNKTAEEALAWEEVSCEHVIQNEWMDLRKLTYRFPNGQEFEPYYSYSRRNYAVIVASDTEGRFICVRQFRQGVKEVTTEFPAGGLEKMGGKEDGVGRDEGALKGAGDEDALKGAGDEGALKGAGDEDALKDAGDEDAIKAARRELLEETGYESDEWEHLLTVPSNATIADNYAYIYRAKNCRKVAELHLDETEFIRVELHDAKEIEEMIYSGRFQQCVHILGWLLAQRMDH